MHAPVDLRQRLALRHEAAPLTLRPFIPFPAVSLKSNILYINNYPRSSLHEIPRTRMPGRLHFEVAVPLIYGIPTLIFLATPQSFP